jgi:short-subunit dehydrogenase
MLAVPYLAALNLTREFLGPMLSRGHGEIVNVTSVASYLAWPGATAYTAARRAVEGFNAALRADVYGSAIGIMLAVFGTVETAYWEHNPGSRERLPKPAGRMRALSPEEAAAALVAGIEKGACTVVKPAIFRLLFMLNALFPAQTESIMCKR